MLFYYVLIQVLTHETEHEIGLLSASIFFNRFFSAFDLIKNKAGYTATEVACGWAGAIFEVARPFGQEQ